MREVILHTPSVVSTASFPPVAPGMRELTLEEIECVNGAFWGAIAIGLGIAIIGGIAATLGAAWIESQFEDAQNGYGVLLPDGTELYCEGDYYLKLFSDGSYEYWCDAGGS
jgi:hypothetical protein